jgi:hypothetical protein
MKSSKMNILDEEEFHHEIPITLFLTFMFLLMCFQPVFFVII